MKLFDSLATRLHAMADCRRTPAEERANTAINRMNVVSERIIATGPTDPLRDALDNLAKHR